MKPRVYYNHGDYLQNMKAKMQISRELTKREIIKHKTLSKEHYDRKGNIKHFEVGEKVLLRNESSAVGKNKKLNAKWLGPYEIICIDSDVNCTVLIKKESKSPL